MRLNLAEHLYRLDTTGKHTQDNTAHRKTSINATTLSFLSLLMKISDFKQESFKSSYHTVIERNQNQDTLLCDILCPIMTFHFQQILINISWTSPKQNFCWIRLIFWRYILTRILDLLHALRTVIRHQQSKKQGRQRPSQCSSTCSISGCTHLLGHESTASYSCIAPLRKQ